MNHYVYVIQSLIDNSFYKGYTTDPSARLIFHNSDLNPKRYSFYKRPWRLVYVEPCPDYKSAIRREISLKRFTRERTLALLDHPKNIVHLF
ncbi:MAG: GIY-YIG nuclease family protein [Saprospiraceae bacterium]|nr:GIY-YIG nuclease family protein [Saprospiraceae bacterium]